MVLSRRKLRSLHLFAGAGGGILADLILGHVPVCAVEIEDYPRRVLLARQRDGILPRFPIWDDVCTFDGEPWRGLVDIVAGGFPCQNISAAGKGEGITGARSGLWGEMARIIGEVRPRFAFVENSPMLVGRGLVRVLGDLAEMGYDARWCIVSASDCGAPHRRDRIWIVADADEERWNGRPGCGEEQAGRRQSQNEGWWSVEPDVGRVVDELADWSHRIKALGNGQVPAVAATAWRILKADFAWKWGENEQEYRI